MPPVDAAGNGRDAVAALTALAGRLAEADGVTSVVKHVAETITTLLNPTALVIALPDPTGVHRVGALPDADEESLCARGREGPFCEPRGRSSNHQMVMGVPVPGTDGAGVVVVTGPAARGGSAERDLELLQAIVSQAAVALTHVALLDRLARGKLEWEQTVDAIPQAFCILSNRGHIRRANRAFADILDTSVKAITNRSWNAVMPAAWVEAVAGALATSDQRTSYELKSETRLLTATAYPMGDAGADDVVLVLEDQTDKRALEEQVIQSAKMSAIGRLIAGIAHDLNNPLASVVGFAEYLVEASADVPTRILEPLRAIHQEASRASKIVKNLLAFARKQEGDRQALEVGPLLESTLLLLQNQLLAYKVEARLQIGTGLPPVEGNANQLQQVFVNLITNAAQAAHNGGSGGTVEVKAEPWLDGVAVIVTDDGPGIPTRLADHVFEPFFTTKGEGEGTGLGLSICHGIVTEHGGQIRLVEGTGPGAAFRVELPGGERRLPSELHEVPDAKRLRILVVDDEPHILHYMRAALESWGHTVEVAPDGKEALETATRGAPFDVIITDLRMPRVGGREFFETLRDTRAALADHVVFATGDTVDADALAFLESVGRPHLKKPFTLDELRAILPQAARGLRP